MGQPITDLDLDAYTAEELSDDNWLSCDWCCEPARTDDFGQADDPDELCLSCRALADEEQEAVEEVAAIRAEMRDLAERLATARRTLTDVRARIGG